MRNGRELDYPFVWIGGGIFFPLKCQFMDSDVLSGIMNFQLVRERRQKIDRRSSRNDHIWKQVQSSLSKVRGRFECDFMIR